MTVRTLFISMIVAVTAAIFAVPAFAQEETGSYTLTEQQINDSFRVNNPRRVRVSDVTVNLVPDAAIVTATYSFRNGETATATGTYVPFVEDGRIYWDVSSVVVNEGDISEDLLDQINTRIDTAWRNYVRGQHTGRFTDVVITDSDMTFFYEVYGDFDADAVRERIEAARENFRSNR